MDSRELWRLSASEILPLMKNGRVKVEEYARSLLDRIQRRDARVKAWVWIDGSHVLQEAKKLDELTPEERGPLFGLPVAVKDVFLTKDMPTRFNSRLYESEVPIQYDANCVMTLRASGALIFGKTTTTEFATTKQGGWHLNHTANAHDPGRTPGGSSSGSAAAVGDFQIPVAIGTQTAGSIVRPASFNGCYGWKPTWGAISRGGMSQFSLTLDTTGFFARSISDFEVLAEAFDVRDDEPVSNAAFSLKGAKIGFCKTSYWPNAGAGTRNAMDRAKEILLHHGAMVEDVQLPSDFDQVLDWHLIVRVGEGRSAFLGQYKTDKTKLHEDIVDFVEEKHGFSRRQQLDAYDNCARLRPVWDDIAEKYDVVITPSVVDEAPKGLESTGDMNFCSMWTMLHVPTINIPGFAGAHGLPIGVTAVAARYRDRHLMRVSQALGRVFEAEGGWQRRNL